MFFAQSNLGVALDLHDGAFWNRGHHLQVEGSIGGPNSEARADEETLEMAQQLHKRRESGKLSKLRIQLSRGLPHIGEEYLDIRRRA